MRDWTTLDESDKVTLHPEWAKGSVLVRSTPRVRSGRVYCVRTVRREKNGLDYARLVGVRPHEPAPRRGTGVLRPRLRADAGWKGGHLMDQLFLPSDKVMLHEDVRVTVNGKPSKIKHGVVYCVDEIMDKRTDLMTLVGQNRTQSDGATIRCWEWCSWYRPIGTPKAAAVKRKVRRKKGEEP